jgi:hypothetical protein
LIILNHGLYGMIESGQQRHIASDDLRQAPHSRADLLFATFIGQ